MQTMEKYYKFFIILLLISFIVPQVAFASWWNPFSWNIWNNIQTIFSALSKSQTASIVPPTNQIESVEKPKKTDLETVSAPIIVSTPNPTPPSNSSPKPTNNSVNTLTAKPAPRLTPKQDAIVVVEPEIISCPTDCDFQDGWYKEKPSYPCCDGINHYLNHYSCTCQEKMYRDFSCVKGACTNVLKEIKIEKSNCYSCSGSDSCVQGICTTPLQIVMPEKDLEITGLIINRTSQESYPVGNFFVPEGVLKISWYTNLISNSRITIKGLWSPLGSGREEKKFESNNEPSKFHSVIIDGSNFILQNYSFVITAEKERSDSESPVFSFTKKGDFNLTNSFSVPIRYYK